MHGGLLACMLQDISCRVALMSFAELNTDMRPSGDDVQHAAYKLMWDDHAHEDEELQVRIVEFSLLIANKICEGALGSLCMLGCAFSIQLHRSASGDWW